MQKLILSNPERFQLELSEGVKKIEFIVKRNTYGMLFTLASSALNIVESFETRVAPRASKAAEKVN